MWEVRTKVICDTLTSLVFASKPTLEQSFDNTADVQITSDEGSKSYREVSYNLIERSPHFIQSNHYLLTIKQGPEYN